MKQSQSVKNSNDFFKNLTLIYFAMLMGQISFLAIVLYLNSTGGQIVTDKLSTSFGIVVFVLSFICVMVGRFLYKRLILQAQPQIDIIKKLQSYQTGVIINLALIEGAVLFSIVVFLLTSQIYFLLFTLLLIIIFLTIRPTKQRAMEDLKIDSEQIDKATFES